MSSHDRYHSSVNYASWHFFIPLETALPVDDGYQSVKHPSGWVRERDEDEKPRPDGVFFKFHHEYVETRPFPGLDASLRVLDRRSIDKMRQNDGDMFPVPPLVVTVAEVVVSKEYRDPLASEGDVDGMSDAFDFAIEQLNIWIQAISRIAGRPFPQVRRESLPPQLLIASGLYEPWDLDGRTLPRVKSENLFNLNFNVPVMGSPPLPAERLDGWMDAALASVSVPGPFAASSSLQTEAEHYHQVLGNYQVAVILYAAACESMFSELLQHLLWEENTRPEDAARYFLRNPNQARNRLVPKSITALVKTNVLPKLLGGSRKGDLPPEIESWIENISELRNHVVHAAYYPSVQEIKKCVSAYDELMQYIADRLFEARHGHEYTALSFLGEKGLAERGVWSEFQNLESHLSEVYERYGAFRRWSMHLDNFRSRSSLIGEPADSDSSKMYLIRHKSGDEYAYAVHAAGSVATKIPSDYYRRGSKYDQISEQRLEELPLDPAVVVSDDPGGFDLPAEATWDNFVYDVIPGPPTMFNQLMRGCS